MERRLILAIVLSFLVLLLYQAIFLKNKPLPQEPVAGPAAIQGEIKPPPLEKPGEAEAKSEAPAEAPKK